ncbi:MAG: cation:dicarboxylase symporter family transporter [Chlamydiota bacterium]
MSIISAVIVGLFFPKVSHMVSPIGKFYFKLLQMCVIPIIMCALISQMGKFVTSPIFRKQIGRVFIGAVSLALLMGVLGVLLGIVGKPVYFSLQPRVEIGRFLVKVETNKKFDLVEEGEVKKFATTTKKKSEIGVSSFLKEIVPSNVFVSFVNEQMPQIIFFSIFLGLGIGYIAQNLRSSLFQGFTVFLESFDQIIYWLKVIFPLGIFCALAEEISMEGREFIHAFFFVFSLFLSGAIFILFCNTCLLAYKTKVPIWKTFLALRETMLVAFGSSSKFVAMPFALEELIQRFRAKKDVVYLLLPLGLTLFPYGFIFTFAFQITFLLIFYGISLSAGIVVFLIFGSILAAISFSGQGGDDPSALPIGVLSTLFLILGFSSNAPLAVFAAFFPVFLPVATVLDICLNCSVITIPEHHREPHPVLPGKLQS